MKIDMNAAVRNMRAMEQGLSDLYIRLHGITLPDPQYRALRFALGMVRQPLRGQKIPVVEHPVLDELDQFFGRTIVPAKDKAQPKDVLAGLTELRQRQDLTAVEQSNLDFMIYQWKGMVAILGGSVPDFSSMLNPPRRRH